MLSDERWTEVTRSEFDHERAGLEFIRRGLPDRESYRAWANFTFTDRDGKLHEVDLLVITETGVHLLELKDYAGTVEGDASTWTVHKPSGARYSLDNPRIAADRKAKRLKSLLLAQSACKRHGLRAQDLYIDAAVFLSNPKGRIALEESGRHGVFARDPAPDQKRVPPVPGILRHLTRPDPHRHTPVGPTLVHAISQALHQAGIRESTTHRRVGSYELGRPIAEGPHWQDFEARHVEQRKAQHRVRVFRPTEGMSQADRDALERAARREFELLHGIDAAVYDSIAHKTPLTSRTNRIVGGNAPSTYLSSLEHNHGVAPTALDDHLRSHWIEPEAIRADDWATFFERRSQAMLQAISDAMGKPSQDLGDDGWLPDLSYDEVEPEPNGSDET